MIGKKSVLLTLIGAVALGGGTLLAADPAAPAPVPAPVPGAPGVGDDSVLGGPHAKPGLVANAEGPLAEIRHRLEVLHEALMGLNLTDPQKADIKKAFQEIKGSLEAWHQANKDALEKLRADLKAAREAKDRDKAQEVLGQIKALLETAPKPELLKQLKGILTPEQFENLIAKLKELKEDGPTTQPAHPGPGARPHHTPPPPPAP